METEIIYDLIGIGIGPFNLGMAVMTDPIPNLKCLFFDENPEFNWHPGMMLDTARLQVPFYADLVTLADPCSRFSFLAFLKAKKRMIRFAILENNFILRKEYNEYCKWVSEQLGNLQFGFRCEAIEFEKFNKTYRVFVRNIHSGALSVYYSRNIVLGVGTIPWVPECVAPHLTPSPSPGGEGSLIFHSSNYLYFKEQILTKKSVSIIGSGQSAAEIFYDLLQHRSQLCNGINWYTRAERFYPMEYSRLSLEMTSPDYIEYFYSLSPEKKSQALLKQNSLYKGINFSLINDIYDQLYLNSFYEIGNKIGLFTHCVLNNLSIGKNEEVELSIHHTEAEQSFKHMTSSVILATGYQYRIPDFIGPIKELIQWKPDPSNLRQGKDGAGTGHAQYQVNRNYSIDSSNSIFVQNAELHTHGFNAPDLGMGPYRNATILNSILGYEHYEMEKNTAFQSFGFAGKDN